MLAASLILLAQSGAVQIEPRAIDQAMDQAMSEGPAARCPARGDEILVCGSPKKSYRVDPVVLTIERDLAEGPPRRPLDASKTVAGSKCIGPQKCGDAVLPLVAVALAALKAATLAAKGEDWRGAFRSRSPEYQRYLEAQERLKKRSKVVVTIGSER
jgi:hypothetical protein